MIALGHAIDRAVVLGQHERTIGELIPLAHVALLGEDLGQLGDLLGTTLAGQARRVLQGELVLPGREELIDRLGAAVRLDERQRIHHQPVVALGEQRLGSSGKRVEMAGAANSSPHAHGMHKAIALEQGQMLPHSDRADAQPRAQFGGCHLAMAPEQAKDLLARLTLFPVLQPHRWAPLPPGASISMRCHEYSTRVSALSRKRFRNWPFGQGILPRIAAICLLVASAPGAWQNAAAAPASGEHAHQLAAPHVAASCYLTELPRSWRWTGPPGP